MLLVYIFCDSRQFSNFFSVWHTAPHRPNAINTRGFVVEAKPQRKAVAVLGLVKRDLLWSEDRQAASHRRKYCIYSQLVACNPRISSKLLEKQASLLSKERGRS